MVEMPGFGKNFNDMSDWIADKIHDIRSKTSKKIFAVVMINHKNDYPRIKNILTKNDVLSQGVQKRTCARMNMSVGTNIMKQVNSKTGGESIRINFPEFMYKNRVMIIGIDVCHAGKKSVVGFTASTNPSATSYYNTFIVQQKGQELVKKELDAALMESIGCFKN